MELVIEGESYRIVEGDEVLASARLFRPYDALLRMHGIVPDPPFPMVLTDLDGTGNPEAMAMLCRFFIRMSKETPIHACVMLSNPKASKLLKVYKKMGCQPEMLMLLLWKGNPQSSPLQT